MKRSKAKVTALLSLVLLLALAGGAMARPVVLEMVTVEDFNDPDGQQWIIRGSKFINSEYPKKLYVNAYPEALFGKYREDAGDLLSLGVAAAWDRKGYNYVEIIPAVEGDAGLEPSPLPIRGRVQRLDMWVWGANYNYSIEVHLMDFRGVPHRLYLGELSHQGWQNLSVDIPGAIPQYVRWIPQDRPLTITKFVIWTRPNERVDNFFVYFDELKVLTDVAEDRFDGDDLARPTYVNDLWKNAEAGE
jgi:hypothetical protein